VLSIEPLTGNANSLSVVKSVFSNAQEQSYTPMFCVTENSYIAQLSLKVGTQDTGFTFFSIDNPASNDIEALCAQQSKMITFDNENDVITWLSSPEASTASNILKSTEIQQHSVSQ
jgi:hypothetical protein